MQRVDAVDMDQREIASLAEKLTRARSQARTHAGEHLNPNRDPSVLGARVLAETRVSNELRLGNHKILLERDQ